jgi:hypothetical protein
MKKLILLFCVIFTTSCSPEISQWVYNDKPIDVYESTLIDKKVTTIPPFVGYFVLTNKNKKGCWNVYSTKNSVIGVICNVKFTSISVTPPKNISLLSIVSKRDSILDIKYPTNPSESNSTQYDSNSQNIQTGPKGGKYYINSNGNKTYIKKKN